MDVETDRRTREGQVQRQHYLRKQWNKKTRLWILPTERFILAKFQALLKQENQTTLVQESHCLILVGSGAKEDMKLPQSGFLISVGSRAKEDKKLPESGFLLVGSGAKEHKKLPESGFLLVGSGARAKEDKKLPESGFLVLVGSGASNSHNAVFCSSPAGVSVHHPQGGFLRRPQKAPSLSLKPAEGLLMKYM